MAEPDVPRTEEMSVRLALTYARARIDAVDARVLLSSLLQRDAAYLIAHADDVLSREQALTYAHWVERRAAGEPVAYITGSREFYGRLFQVTPGVLIPRPETELLVDVALGAVRGRAICRLLDLGTGSGCIALTLAAECPVAEVTGVDASDAALAVARRNAAALTIDRVRWVRSDWYEALAHERCDVIVANPPYIAAGDRHLREGDLRYEPRMALTPGDDGSGALRAIVEGAAAHLVRGGALWMEHGYDQGALCRDLLTAAGYAAVATHRDLAGQERVTGGVLPGG